MVEKTDLAACNRRSTLGMAFRSAIIGIRNNSRGCAGVVVHRGAFNRSGRRLLTGILAEDVIPEHGAANPTYPRGVGSGQAAVLSQGKVHNVRFYP